LARVCLSVCPDENVRTIRHLTSIFGSFVRSILRAGVQPTLDPSTETVERSNVLAQERGGELVAVCKCVRDVQGEEG